MIQFDMSAVLEGAHCKGGSGAAIELDCQHLRVSDVVITSVNASSPWAVTKPIEDPVCRGLRCGVVHHCEPRVALVGGVFNGIAWADVSDWATIGALIWRADRRIFRAEKPVSSKLATLMQGCLASQCNMSTL